MRQAAETPGLLQNGLRTSPRVTVGRFTALRRRRSEYSRNRLKCNTLASRRGQGCYNTLSRRQFPATIQLAVRQIVPPLTCERGERIGNNMSVSSPNSSSLQDCLNAGADALQPVRPVQPAAPYIGGKRNLAKRLVERIASTPHTAYAEPFVGMGGVFLKRTVSPRAEIINDWSMDVATFFRILQRHYVAFMDMLRYQITSRTGFERLVATDPATLTDLERAARFLYLQRIAFGGRVSSRHFGVSTTGSSRFDVTKLGPVLETIHERLSGVVIERLHWHDFITRYDRPYTLFYCDPPYYGNEQDYGKSDAGKPLFGRDQFALMAEVFSALKGRVILSINDTPEVREIFAGFDLQQVTTTYTLGGTHNAKKAGELIISN